MKTRLPEQADAERAVMAFKHDLLLKVMRFIVNQALAQLYVFPGDVPEDIVAAEHRQGVVSNAWGSLDALEILEKLPLTFNNPELQIFAGRKQNKNEAAKGRWTAVYRLRNRELALTWLARNPAPLVPALRMERFIEQELVLQ